MLPIVDVGDASQQFIEQLGTKPKFWYRDSDNRLTLCKIVRPNTGEDWSEVVAAEIADRIGLPHAGYTLATYRGSRAVITPSFVPGMGSLVVGSELLSLAYPEYDSRVARFKQTAHTVSRVLAVLDNSEPQLPCGWQPPEGITTALQVFIGYLALDALIGNTDRHHENWGLVAIWDRSTTGITFHLAPTFDHASSLGCHATESEKSARLHTANLNYSPRAYAKRARSGLFQSDESTRPLLTKEAFARAAEFDPEAARHWLRAIDCIPLEEIDVVLGQVHPDRISGLSRRFALEVIRANKEDLNETQKNL